jgi:hypothetical protein
MSDNNKKQAWIICRDLMWIMFMKGTWKLVEPTGRCKRIKGGIRVGQSGEKIQYEIKEPTLWNRNRTRWVDDYDITFRYPETEEIFECKCGEA